MVVGAPSCRPCIIRSPDDCSKGLGKACGTALGCICGTDPVNPEFNMEGAGVNVAFSEEIGVAAPNAAIPGIDCEV